MCAELNIPRSTLHNKLKKKYTQKPGRPTVLNDEEELSIAEHLLATADWGFPFDGMDIMMLVKSYLDKIGRTVALFKNNLPGPDWLESYLKRHSDMLRMRLCQNISRKRAGVSKTAVIEYFNNLQVTLEDIPPQNIINYDETNLSDDPGRKKVVVKRGTNPERIMNSSKSSTSLMLAGTAAGELLPVYVVYKSEKLWDIENGPNGARYNRSKSGWFDNACFEDWFQVVAFPFCKRKSGRCVVIGDNLSSHFSPEVIKLCNENNISFCCLPPNSTHLCQPLDVSFFRPMKTKWRTISADYKERKAKPFKRTFFLGC